MLDSGMVATVGEPASSAHIHSFRPNILQRPLYLCLRLVAPALCRILRSEPARNPAFHPVVGEPASSAHIHLFPP